MSRYTRKQQPLKLDRIVQLHQAGKLDHERAVAAVYRLGRSIMDSVGGNEEDRSNIERFVECIVAEPVEDWVAAFKFWSLSILIDAPWVVWRDAMAVN